MRRRYLDWMRGLAVVIMIEAHTVDSWTQASDRPRALFGDALIVGGFGAPLFLFLAGVAVALAGGARARKTGSVQKAAASVRRRGWQIFGLAFLFRLQSYVLNPGSTATNLLKVDILNIMGPSIAFAAIVWGRAGSLSRRLMWYSGITVALAFLTPIVRTTAWLDPLPDPLEWYLRPSPGHTNFTTFPWAGFVFAGAFVGVLLESSGRQGVGTLGRDGEWPAVGRIGACGFALASVSYAASYLPSPYAVSDFWTSSPAFFFLRVGILTASLLPIYLWAERGSRSPRSPMEEFGRSSLFVYWIHVEIVYGVLTWPLHKSLSLEHAFLAFGLFTVVLFGVTMVKVRAVNSWRLRHRQPPAAREVMPRTSA